MKRLSIVTLFYFIFKVFLLLICSIFLSIIDGFSSVSKLLEILVKCSKNSDMVTSEELLNDF